MKVLQRNFTFFIFHHTEWNSFQGRSEFLVPSQNILFLDFTIGKIVALTTLTILIRQSRQFIVFVPLRCEVAFIWVLDFTLGISSILFSRKFKHSDYLWFLPCPLAKEHISWCWKPVCFASEAHRSNDLRFPLEKRVLWTPGL